MKNMITIETLKQLAAHRQFPSISVLLPTHKAGMEVKEEKDKIVFKNQLKEVERALTSLQMKPLEIKEQLQPFEAMLSENNFWSNLEHGLAVYKSGRDFEIIKTPEPLPEFSVVQESYYIAPLIPIAQDNRPFYLLELNLSEVLLYRADRYQIEKMDVQDITPQRLEEVVGSDFREKSLQYHGYGAGAGQTMFHGQGEGTDDTKRELQKFFAAVDNGIMKVTGQEQVPLILACVDYFHPLYRDVSNYKNIYPSFIKGSHKNEPPSWLHNEAVALLENHFDEGRSSRLEKFRELAGTAQTAKSIEYILPEAETGKVRHLILKYPSMHFGNLNRQQRMLRTMDKNVTGSNELLNEAAIATMLNGGTVDLVPEASFPVKDSNAVAVFRY